ncbi:MAG: sugar phosphate isomerase/epimerase [Pirellulales bacterium]|nr:sugar phosphate isomerase/epimerase [Pirellulales bacterium]
MIRRRQFLAGTASALVATQLTATQLAQAQPARRDNKICVFTKPFQSLSYDQLAARIAELNCDGIEATIRDGGHIEPSQVPEELPKLVEALRRRGLEITVMASSINDPRDPLTESVLRTASALGIKRYRMKYFHYDLGQPIGRQLQNWKSIFADLAALNQTLGIGAVYQNHAGGRNLGASLWDLAEVLEGIPVDQIAVAYDIRHATVEGGMSWPVTFQMIRPHIDTVYVKDFVWGQGARPTNVPLGKGRVDRKFFKMLRDSQFEGPISLHEEYLDHRQPELVPQHLEAIQRDLATLREWLKS